MEVYNGGGSGDNSGGSGDNSRSDSDQNYQNSPGSSSRYSIAINAVNSGSMQEAINTLNKFLYEVSITSLILKPWNVKIHEEVFANKFR